MNSTNSRLVTITLVLAIVVLVGVIVYVLIPKTATTVAETATTISATAQQTQEDLTKQQVLDAVKNDPRLIAWRSVVPADRQVSYELTSIDFVSSTPTANWRISEADPDGSAYHLEGTIVKNADAWAVSDSVSNGSQTYSLTELAKWWK